MTMKINAYCPTCGYEVDDATGVGDAAELRPGPGGIAICIRCAGLGVYFEQKDGTLGLRPPTEKENVELADSEEITKVRAAIIGRDVWLNK
jgi:hypothetical protein